MDLDQTCQLTFKQSIEQANGYDSRPLQVAVGDFNRDGDLDIVVANSGTDSIGIFIGYGNGTFSIQMTYLTGVGSRPYSVAVGDFNNDALLDIVVTNYGINGIGVFLGYRNGSFGSQIITSLGSSHPLSVAIGDFNNDNLLDITVANYGTFIVAVLLGSNNGSFRIDTIHSMGYDSIPYFITAADFNRDNKLDIVAVNYGTNELAILLADENGSFIIHKYSTGKGSHPCSVAIGDFNKDNVLDIAVANSDTSNIGIFLGNENGTFRDLVTFSTGSGSRPQFIVVSDFNNDTKLDIAVVDSEYNNVLAFEGNGGTSFTFRLKHSTGYNGDPCSIAVGDFNNDNKPDIAVTNNGTNSVLILTSMAIYPVTSQVEYSIGTDAHPYYVNVGDFNEDGNLDIVVPGCGTNNVGIFINLGNGTFGNQSTYYMGESSCPSYIATGDLNNDNHLDMVVTLLYISKIGILLGYGDGTFRNGNIYFTGDNSLPFTAAVDDFNNDGNLDIITSNFLAANVGIFFGFGNGTFTDMTALLTQLGYHPQCVGVSDFNNDNILDIAAADSLDGGIAILLGYGDGTFQNPLLTSTEGDIPHCFTIGDLNSDLRSDIVYTDGLYSHVGVLLGSGNGTFESLTEYSVARGSEPWYVALGYYNNDNLLDMAVSSGFDSSINIFLGTGNGAFGTPHTLSTGYGSWPWSVMFGDFDNNNPQDLVVANDQTNNILIFFVHYIADFANETNFTTGSGPHPYSVSVQDLNNDGQSDIVVANSGNDDIEIFLDYNKGTFMNRTIFSTDYGSHPQCVTIADFNKDSLLDIAVVNFWNNNMDVFLGFGNGSLDTKTVYSTGSASFPNSITAGDFNKDGRMDIVVANQGTDNVAVFLAFDYVTFTNYIIYVPGFLPNPSYVVTGDFNNDYQLDIAVVNLALYFFGIGNLGIYLGYGNGTFSQQISYPTGYLSYPTSLAIGDFDNDNYLDIVVANSGTNSIGVFMGYGNGSFQSQISYSTGNSSTPKSVAIGDFNNDSRLDIVAVNSNSDNVCIFLGYGNGSFTRRIVYSMPNTSNPISVAVNDFNNDNILDIVVANSHANNVCILLGYGDGSFENVITLSTGSDSGPCSIGIGDFNKDKSLDIAVANQISKNIGIFFGYGNGTFSSQNIYPAGSDSDLSSIVVSDVNNDTILDILATDYNAANSSIGIYYGFGNGNFTLPKIYSTGLNTLPSSIATGDFNNDSKVDLAITYFVRQSIGIMLQLKNEPFASSAIFPTGDQSYPKSVAIGDFNNDDQPDIAIANSGTNNIGILLGYGNGYFNDQLTYSTGSNSLPSSITVGHFNNDYYLDIAVANSATDNIGILLGYGNGKFANITTYSTGLGSDPSFIVIGDLNKDNYLDLVVANWGINNILVFFGIGNGTFFEPKLYSIGYNARPQSVAIGDINNDNLLDIVVANYGANYVEILLQTC